MVTTVAPAWGVCSPWTTDADFADLCTVVPSTLVQLVASELLYVMTARQWPGVCTRTGRPMHQACADYGPLRVTTDSMSLGYSGGGWMFTSSGNFVPDGNCCDAPCVQLVGYPIVSIDQVRVDGVVLPQSAYHVDDWTYLCRDDGQVWPACQNTRLLPTQPGTWEVQYHFGTAPPASGVYAAVALACEIAKAAAGDTTCRLPRRVQVVTRQNVTVALLDPMTFVTDGRTGLLDVDMFINAANPGGLSEAPAVITPDTMHSPTRRTWTT
jgi:hypothetical protein